MTDNGPVIALVPARQGSKGVPDKNVADLGGFPLLAYSVVAGVLADRIDRVIVTTDSEAFAQLARTYGGEAPFLRPAELAADDSLDIDYVRHALDWLGTHESVTPSLVVQLRPTTPLRSPARLDAALDALAARPDATGLRSVHELAEPPQKMLGIEDGVLVGLFPHEERPDYFNLPRQAFPPAYWPNGYVDIIRPATIETEASLYGSRVLAHVTEQTVEVDTPDDLDFLRFRLERGEGRELCERLEEAAVRG